MDERVKKWLIKGMEDITTIEHELRLPEDEVVTSTVCFHAQQAAEKFLKAFLVSKKMDFGKTHNLDFLLSLCSKQDSDFRAIDVGSLSFYGVEVRYPDEFYIPSFQEARTSFDIASRVKEFVFKKLGVEGLNQDRRP
ncbi:MAG: HEPN domain-containing protein [Chloroflexi bacterium]|nr:HEPN domain-containing protein [Chloroflexota bacterium]